MSNAARLLERWRLHVRLFRLTAALQTGILRSSLGQWYEFTARDRASEEAAYRAADAHLRAARLHKYLERWKARVIHAKAVRARVRRFALHWLGVARRRTALRQLAEFDVVRRDDPHRAAFLSTFLIPQLGCDEALEAAFPQPLKNRPVPRRPLALLYGGDPNDAGHGAVKHRKHANGCSEHD